MNKPHIKKSGTFMYACSGEGVRAYSYSPQGSYETWKNILELRKKGMFVLNQLYETKQTNIAPILNYGDGVEYQERLRGEWE